MEIYVKNLKKNKCSILMEGAKFQYLFSFSKEGFRISVFEGDTVLSTNLIDIDADIIDNLLSDDEPTFAKIYLMMEGISALPALPISNEIDQNIIQEIAKDFGEVMGCVAILGTRDNSNLN